MAEDGDINGEDPEIPKVSWAYATKKTVAEGMINAALLVSNAAQLKALFVIKSSNRDGFWYTQMVLVVLSIALQVIASILLLLLGLEKPKTKDQCVHCDKMNNAATLLILLITIINLIISGFGMQLTDSS